MRFFLVRGDKTYLRLKSKWKAPELTGIFIRINISFSAFGKHSVGPPILPSKPKNCCENSLKVLSCNRICVFAGGYIWFTHSHTSHG